jgi:two-component system chemotaxis response regulator CheB
MKKIKVLVVEDSAFMRKAMKNILEKYGDIEVIATARDGEDGVNKARELHPHVVTMDINMPGMDGLTALHYIVSENICPVIIVSSLAREGAVATFEALELGAFDYVLKPGGTVSLDIKKVENEIIEKVRAAAKNGTLSRIRNRFRYTPSPGKNIIVKDKTGVNTGSAVVNAVVIGISTGGPKTLSDIIGYIPPDLNAAVFIVQHMPPNFTLSFAKRLDKMARIPVKEAETGEIVKNNSGYLAKGGQHLLLRKKNDGKIMIRLSTIPEHLFIPSVDIMMESVLNVFERRTVGVLMTGMGDDGARSMLKIKQAGGITIAESEETAVVFGMPKEAIDLGAVDIVTPSYKIPEEIVKAMKKL